MTAQNTTSTFAMGNLKKYMLFLILLPFSFIYSKAQTGTPPSAGNIIKEACHQAVKEHKNVFIMFHASWCGWCKRMDSLMLKTDCSTYFEKYYVISHIDVKESPDKKYLENPGGEELLKKYHGDNQGIPYWLILDKNGKLLADSRIKPVHADPEGKYNNAGCPAEPDEVAYFLRVLKETSSLTNQQLSLIGKHFGKD